LEVDVIIDPVTSTEKDMRGGSVGAAIDHPRPAESDCFRDQV